MVEDSYEDIFLLLTTRHVASCDQSCKLYMILALLFIFHNIFWEWVN